MFLGNYTPDTIEYMYGGRPGKIAPGKVIEVDESTGNHVLNKFSARGLVKLLFGDDPQEMKAEAMAIYTRFWERQIMTYNQDNEKRRNTNREYVEPTRQLVQKAQELGIKIVGPWSIERVDDKVTAALMQENAQLRTALGSLMQEVQSIKHAVAGGKDMPDVMQDALGKLQAGHQVAADNPDKKVVEEPVAGIPDAEEPTEEQSDPPAKGEDYKVVRFKVAKMGKKTFSNWVMENIESFNEGQYPAEFVKECRDKWTRLYDEDWPFPE